MVVSIDPRRVYINAPDDVEFKAVRVTNPGNRHAMLDIFVCLDLFVCIYVCAQTFHVILLPIHISIGIFFIVFSILVSGPNGEEYAWYQCTVSFICFLPPINFIQAGPNKN